jgi:hypothetical protein
MTASPPLPIRLLVWLMVQLAVLMIGAFGVPIYARHGDPREMLAIHEMMACQIGLSALIFPWLLSSWRHAIAIIVSSVPFILIAGWLSTTSSRTIGLCLIHVTLWLAALVAVDGIVRSCYRMEPSVEKPADPAISAPALYGPPRSNTSFQSLLPRLLVLLMTLWSIGGAVLYYLRLEFAGRGNPLLFGPVVSGLKMASGGLSHFGYFQSIVLLIVGLITSRLARR